MKPRKSFDAVNFGSSLSTTSDQVQFLYASFRALEVYPLETVVRVVELRFLLRVLELLMEVVLPLRRVLLGFGGGSAGRSPV